MINGELKKIKECESLEDYGMKGKLSCKPGDTVWCIERKEDEDYIDYSGYLFVGVCKDYVLVCPRYMMCESFEEQLDEMCENAIEHMHSDIVMFKRKDVYMTQDEAKAAAAVHEWM